MNTCPFASTATPAHSPSRTVGGSFGQSLTSSYARPGAASRVKWLASPTRSETRLATAADAMRMLASSGKLSQHRRHDAPALLVAFGGVAIHVDDVRGIEGTLMVISTPPKA